MAFVREPPANPVPDPEPALTEEEIRTQQDHTALGWCCPQNHSVIAYKKILEKGYEGMLEEIEAGVQKNGPLPIYTAMRRICLSACNLGKRYADKARELLQNGDSAYDRADLEAIIRICDRVPRHPASSFKEAAQALLFAHILNTWEDDGDDWGANKWIKNREDFCSPIIEEGYTQMLRDDKEKTRQCMQFIFDCVKNNKPVYFHCSLGRDRTGTVAMLTLGILGVDEGDISQEYELTQFAPSGYSVSEGEKTQMTRKVDYKSAATFIWDNYAKGGSFQQGVQAYLLEIGISQKDIDDFRAAMLQ